MCIGIRFWILTLSILKFFIKGIGIYYCCTGGHQRTTVEYVLGNRQMSVLPVAVSTLASFVSAITMQGVPADVYFHGLQYIVYGTGGSLGCVIVAFLFVPLFYPLKLTSVYEYLEYRFQSRLARLTGSILYLILGVIFMGVVIFGPSIALEGVIGVPMWISMLIMAVFSTFYTTIGGLKAVIWADVLQGVIMIISVIVIVIMGVIRVGGVQETWKLLDQGGRLNFFNFDFDPTQKCNFWLLQFAFVFNWLGVFTLQPAVQRLNSVSTMAKSQLSMVITGLGFAVLGCISVISGAVAYAYYAKIRCDPVKAGIINNPNQILPYFALEILNYPGLPGLFVACIYSASLSTLSSLQNSCATCVWEDVIQIKFHGISESKKLMVVKIAVVLSGVMALVMGLAVGAVGGSLFQISATFISSPLGPILGMYILGAGFTFTTGLSASLAAIISFIISLWIGIGRIFCGTWWNPPLETITDSCGFVNATSYETASKGDFTLSTIMEESTSSIFDIPSDRCGPLMWLYSLSPLITPLLGTVITVILGVLFSLIENKVYPKNYNIDPKYLFHIPRYCVSSGVTNKTEVEVKTMIKEDKKVKKKDEQVL